METNVSICDNALVETKRNERKEKMKLVIAGVVMICIAAVVGLFKPFSASPKGATRLSQVTFGDFKAMMWQLTFTQVIATSGIIITALGLIK